MKLEPAIEVAPSIVTSSLENMSARILSSVFSLTLPIMRPVTSKGWPSSRVMSKTTVQPLASPMTAWAVMVTPLLVAEAPMGRPILSMISVWAGAVPKTSAKTWEGAGRTPAATATVPPPTAIASAAATAAMRAQPWWR